MRVRFNGMYSRVSKGGCPCRGGGGKSKVSFMTNRSLQLPSGRYMTFHYNEVYDVSAEDSAFLMGYTFEKDGMTFHAFTEEK